MGRGRLDAQQDGQDEKTPREFGYAGFLQATVKPRRSCIPPASGNFRKREGEC